MLSAAARRQPRAISTRAPSLVILARSLATESASEHRSDPPPLTDSTQASSSRRPGLYPRPRPAGYEPPKAISSLPSTFGRNQMLNVSDSRRAILESIVNQFDAPIRYAVAYGSGVFEQDGYNLEDLKGPKAPMLDFLFAVTHPDHFHSINVHQHPSHYPFHARVLGSDYISRVQGVGPGVWFNAYVPMNGQVRSLVFSSKEPGVITRQIDHQVWCHDIG
jgi:mitochondrial translocator assembly and maintenance protein 41